MNRKALTFTILVIIALLIALLIVFVWAQSARASTAMRSSTPTLVVKQSSDIQLYIGAI